MKKIIFAHVITFILLFIGCGDEPLNVETLQFHPEYDYMDGFDVFPDGYDYAAKAFSGGNVNFSPYTSDADFPAYYLGDMKELYGFIYDNAICINRCFWSMYFKGCAIDK